MLMGNVKVTRLHYHWMLFWEGQCQPNCSSPVLFIIIFLTATWLHSPTPLPFFLSPRLTWGSAGWCQALKELQTWNSQINLIQHLQECLPRVWNHENKGSLSSSSTHITYQTLRIALFPSSAPFSFFLLFSPLLSTFSLCWWQSKGFPHSVSLGEWLSNCS